jgi:hypothetical protein
MIRKTAQGYEGVASDDEYFDPITLTESDVRQFQFSLPGFVEFLRKENGICGDGITADGNLITVGQKNLEGYGDVEVYLALENSDPCKFFTLCRSIRITQGIKKVVLLIPCPVSLTNAQRQLLDSQGIILISLLQGADHGTLALDWQSRVIAASSIVTPDGFRAPRTIVWKGCEHTCDLTKKEQAFLTIAISEEFIEIARVMHSGDHPLWKSRFRNEEKQRDTISQFLSRLNRKLASAKPIVPLSFSLKRGRSYIQRRILNISVSSSR